MIADTLTFLRRHLDDHLRSASTGSEGEPTGDKVVFVDAEQSDAVGFKKGAVTALLVNLEEERTLRSPDRHARRSSDGKTQRVQPDIRLILYVLFVARFRAYDVAWAQLSKIIEHFQSVRVFDAEATPAFPSTIDRLTLELVTLDFAQQNEVWSALRTAHLPSVLYRVKLVRVQDGHATTPPTIEVVEPTVRRIS